MSSSCPSTVFEGHETEALEGASRTIDRDRPALGVEVVSGDPDVTGTPSQLLMSSLAGWGYEPYWLEAGRLMHRRLGNRSVNYFFLTQAHLSSLRAHGIVPA